MKLRHIKRQNIDELNKINKDISGKRMDFANKSFMSQIQEIRASEINIKQSD